MIKTTTIKIFSTAAFIFTLLSLFTSNAFAGFGPGHTSGWDTSVTGLNGVLSGYKSPANLYETGETATFTASITNPNPSGPVIQQTIYLNIQKVMESPIGRSISGGKTTVSESELFVNNQSGDIQYPVYSENLGLITVNPGETVNITRTFSSLDSGYYQIDFTTLNPSSSYEPGHIVAAGFIRILEQLDNNDDDDDPNDKHGGGGNNNDNDNDNGSNGNNNTSSNQISNNPGTFFGGINIPEVLGDSDVKETTEEVEKPIIKNETKPKPEVKAETSCREEQTYWWIVWIITAASLLALNLLMPKDAITQKIMGSVLISTIAIIYWFFNRCACSDLWLCNWTPLVIVLMFGIASVVFNLKRDQE